tara:strand:- start:221 stop:424 length:204 start_codon:yes stop_codon:yes gene_type:complete
LRNGRRLAGFGWKEKEEEEQKVEEEEKGEEDEGNVDDAGISGGKYLLIVCLDISLFGPLNITALLVL